MEDINKIFRAALEYVFEHTLTRHGDQIALANSAEVPATTLNDILKGRRNGSEETRRALAAALDFPGRLYEDFLDIGRAILAGRPIPTPPADYVSPADMAEAGWFQVPLADRPGAGKGHGLATPENTAHIMVHGPTLGRKNSHGLRAFVVGGDSMEPLLVRGGIVVADLTKNRAENLKEGAVYVISYDEEGAGAVKYLRWVEKGKVLSLESENKSYKPVFRKAREVILIGRVIWSCRKHE
jgi:hypothetical protein